MSNQQELVLTIRDTMFAAAFGPSLFVAVFSLLLVIVAHVKIPKLDDDDLTTWVRVRAAFGYLGTIALALAVIFLSMYDYFYRWWVSAIVLIIGLPIIWQIQFGWFNVFLYKVSGKRACRKMSPGYRDLERSDEKDPFEMSNLKFYLLVAACILIIGACVFLSWFFSSMCYCSQPTEYSWTGTRYGKPEPSNCSSSSTPCIVYFTLGVNISTDVIVQFHSGTKYTKPVAIFGTNSATLLTSGTRLAADRLDMDYIAQHVERYVYRVLLPMTPSSTFYVMVGDADTSSYSTIRKIRTPAPDASQITFAAGGDLGYMPTHSEPVLQQIAASEPYFFAFGGDIAYDNSFSGCYRRWDDVLMMLERNLVTPTGFTVPMILAIGNHEAGISAPPSIFGGRRSIPYYFKYFWHGVYPDGDDMEDSVWHHHFIGNDTILLALDSDILNRPDGDQAAYITKTLKNTPRKNRITLYHVPMYPGYRQYDSHEIATIRNLWVPLFDELNVTLGLENHDHCYKRSKMLYNDKVVPDGSYGTLYVGDGSLGAEAKADFDAAKSQARFYIEKATAVNFMLRVDINLRNITVTAIDGKATQFDAVSRVSA